MGGTLDYSIRDERIKHNDVLSNNEIDSIRLGLRNNGVIMHPRIGTYGINAIFSRETRDFSHVSGTTHFRLNDYSIATSLFPRLTPLTFYMQRLSREYGRVVGGDLKSSIKTYNLNWIIPFEKLPKVRFNLYQTEIADDTGGTLPGQKIFQERISRSFSVESDGKWHGTRLLTRYQHTNQKVRFSGTSVTDSINVTVNSRLSKQMALRAYVNVQKGDSSLGGSAQPGVAFVRENSLGTSISYIKDRFIKADLSYDFYNSPISSLTNFKRHALLANLNLHPTFKLDLSSNFRALFADAERNTTDSFFESFGVNYRPMFGFNTGTSFSTGTTNIKGNGASETFYQNYRYFVGYTKTLRVIRLNTGYSIGFGKQDTEPTGAQFIDVSSAFHAGATNVDTEKVVVSLNYSLDDSRRNSNIAVIDESRINSRISVAIATSYPRNLIIRGDNLRAESSTSLVTGSGFGIEGNIITFDAKVVYYAIRGVTVVSGFTSRTYPSNVREDRRSYFSEVQWFRYVWRYLNLKLKAKESVDDNRFTSDSKNFEGSANLSWMLGSTSFNLEYKRSRSSRGNSISKNEGRFFRVTRSFSIFG